MAQVIIYVAVHVPANFVNTRMHHHITLYLVQCRRSLEVYPGRQLKESTEQYITRLYQLIKKIIFLVLQSST